MKRSKHTGDEIIERLRADYKKEGAGVDAVICYDPLYACWLEKQLVSLVQAAEDLVEELQ